MRDLPFLGSSASFTLEGLALFPFAHILDDHFAWSDPFFGTLSLDMIYPFRESPLASGELTNILFLRRGTHLFPQCVLAAALLSCSFHSPTIAGAPERG